VAKLRHTKTNDHVLLLKTNMGAGHGGQSGRFTALEELAEEYAFFLLHLAPEQP
jgi:oligopeptidase B